MAKKIDESKIERIRSAAVSMFSEEGVTGISVAQIADRAGVSAGYLYRHYSGKEELVNDLVRSHLNILNEKIETLVRESNDTAAVIDGVVRHILSLAEKNEQAARFVIMVVNDFSIKISDELMQQVDNLARQLFSLLRNDKRVRDNVSEEDMYFALVGVPIQYLTLRYKNIYRPIEGAELNPDHIVSKALGIIMKEN